MVFLLLLIAIIIGFLTGMVTGLIPGIHVNTVAAIMVGISVLFFSLHISPICIAVYIAATSISHCFFDYVPSLFLGVPNDEVFSLLPGQQMVKDGRGLEALHLSVRGSWTGLMLGIGLLVVFLTSTYVFSFNIVADVEATLRPYLFWILLVVSFFLIATEKRIIWALVIFVISGLFGLIVFSSPLVPGGTNAAFSILFPALSGIFGVSGLILSLFEKTGSLTKQEEKVELQLDNRDINGSSFRGTIAGMAVGLLPGLGGANAATVLLLIEQYIGRKKKNDLSGMTYIVTTSSINTSDTLFGIAALYLIEKSRSGASVAINQLMGSGFTIWSVIIIAISMIIAAFLAKKTLHIFGNKFVKIIAAMNYKALHWGVIFFTTILVYLTTGIWGFVILFAGTLLGMMAPLINIRRSQAMGFFLIPVILFFSGHERQIVSWLHMDSKTTPATVIDINEVVLYLLFSFISGGIIYFSINTFVRVLNNKKMV